MTVGIVVFVLGLIGMMVCQILGPIALVLGFVTMRKAQAEERPLNPFLIIGMALGAFSTVLLLMTLLMTVGLCCLYVAIFALAFVGALLGA